MKKVILAALEDGDQEAMALYAQYEILYYEYPPVPVELLNYLASLLLCDHQMYLESKK